MPGVDGAAKAPISASVASVARSGSLSNQALERGARRRDEQLRDARQIAPQAEERARDAAEAAQVAQRESRRVGRRHVEQRFEGARGAIEESLVVRIARGVARREARRSRARRAPRSGPSSSPRPSASGVNDEGSRRSRRRPRASSPSSRITAGRSSPATYAARETR